MRTKRRYSVCFHTNAGSRTYKHACSGKPLPLGPTFVRDGSDMSFSQPLSRPCRSRPVSGHYRSGTVKPRRASKRRGFLPRYPGALCALLGIVQPRAVIPRVNHLETNYESRGTHTLMRLLAQQRVPAAARGQQQSPRWGFDRRKE